MNIPRNEYPRPQMMRDDWRNLNGYWEFEFDFSRSGKERDVLHQEKFSRQILVPFCPESELSGINHKDFIEGCWYRREFTLPTEWKNGRVLLNFEAVDYSCEVWVNEKPVGKHKGGYTPFSFDITKSLNEGVNTITVYVEDLTRSGQQPRGKQAGTYDSRGCCYTRVTGIWQTVWMEYVPQVYIQSYKCIPDPDNCRVHLDVYFGDGVCDKKIKATAKYEDRTAGDAYIRTSGNTARFSIKLSELHLWEPLDAKIYDLEIVLDANGQTDRVRGYFGMRKLELAQNCMLINGKPVFQRLVLDQGYYPDGIYTAPDDNALKRDIQLSLDLGFNGARLHEKVFERRFIYWADKMGYLIWGEYGNWGFDHSKHDGLELFLPEWMEAVERDLNSPALIGWCPFNETWDIHGNQQDDELLRCVYHVTKAVDKTRPVIDTSGNFHVVTDIFDVHNYTQEVDQFKEHFQPMAEGGEVYNKFANRQTYKDQPYFVSEYGGIWWSNIDDEKGWGYGKRPGSVEEYVKRYVGLADVLLSNPRIFALCYTQLYDVEQEINGIYNYDRTPKFSAAIMQKLKRAMEQKAEIERSSEQGLQQEMTDNNR